jgi:hypothetical protein
MEKTHLVLEENADLFEIAATVALVFTAYGLDEIDIEEVCAIAFDLSEDMRNDMATLH